MISDWRGDRRIGPSSLQERARGPLALTLIVIGLLAAVSVFVVFIKTFGQPINWFSNLRLWALVFGLEVAVIAVTGYFGPQKGTAIALGMTGSTIAILVWVLALPILSAFGIVMIVPIR